MHRRAALSLLATAPLAAMTGCARPRRDESGALEVVLPADPLSLDPRFAADAYGFRIGRLVHAALVRPDADTAEATPWLASTIEDGPRGELIVTLREGAAFHDGTPVRARDVVATLLALKDPRLGSPSRRVIGLLDTIDALDDRRVRLASATPRATLRDDLDVPILEAGEAGRARGASLIGAGPFRMEARDGGITLTPAASYAWSPDGVAKHPLVVRTVRDEAARALRIVAGAVDVAANVLSPPLALSLPHRSDAAPGLSVRTRASSATTMLMMQCTRPPLDRPEVRRAVAAAIDRRAIVQAKLGGAATLASGLLPPTIALAPKSRPKPIEGDPRSVLAPLGAAGARLSLVTSNDRARVGIARAIAQSITDAGLPTEAHAFEFGTFFGRLNAGDFDLAPVIATEITDPEVLRWYLHSGAIPPNGANRARFRDRDVDALLDRGLATLDREARRAIYEELERRVAELVPYAPLWHEDHVAVTSSRAASFRPSVDGRWGALARL